MATYSSIDKLHQQVDYIQSATTITSASKVSFIEDAESIINSKLGKYYTVPFSSVPPIITTICTDIAVYRILRMKGFRDSTEKENWVTKFTQAMDFLKDIQKGNMSLVNSDGSIISISTSNVDAVSNTMDYKPVFDLRPSESWVVDPDLIDAEDDASD